MSDQRDPLEDFWDNLLSQDQLRIMAAWESLDPQSQEALLVHLQNMARGDGWLDIQRFSAQAALDVIAAQGG